MKIIVADTGALLSLAHANCIDIIEKLFGELFIAQAVWDELNNYDNPHFNKEQIAFLYNRVIKISSKNHLTAIIDLGESESAILYEELQANFLLIDDSRARVVAESLNIKCIGSIGVLMMAKQKGLITELKPIFEIWLASGRFFSTKLLNAILLQMGETELFK